MSERVHFEFEGTQSAEQAATMLRSLADGFDAGTELSFGDGEAVVATPDRVDVEVELESEGDQLELEVEFGWSGAAISEDGSIESEDAAEEGSALGDEPDVDDGAGAEPAESAEIEVDADAIPADLDEGEDPTVAAPDAASLARFEVFRDRAEEWRWRLVHRNGNVIATSGEGYTQRHNALKGLRSVVANAPGADVESAE